MWSVLPHAWGKPSCRGTARAVRISRERQRYGRIAPVHEVVIVPGVDLQHSSCVRWPIGRVAWPDGYAVPVRWHTPPQSGNTEPTS